MKTILRNTVGKARFLGPAVIVAVALVLISNLAYAYTTSNLWILKVQEDRFYNYDFDDEGNAVAFIEDFEWGSDGDSLAESGGDVDWWVNRMGGWFGNSRAEIDTAQKHTGGKSARLYRGNWGSAYMQAYYLLDPPTYRGFYFKKDANSVLYTTNGDGDHRIIVRVIKVNNDQTVQYYSGSWQPVCTLTEAGWHLLEFKDIDWEDGTYDIYVDDVREENEANMQETPSREYNGMTAYSNPGGTDSQCWIDDIGAPSSTDVTCPATMVFDTNALTSKVKDDIYWGTASPLYASTDYALLNDGDGWIWDEDRGTKKTYTIYISEIEDWVDVHVHLRVYAPDSTDYMSNSEWGKYVIGTTHCDEGSVLELWYGFNEDAENFLAGYASDEGYTVSEDIIYFNNYEARVELIIHPYWGIPTYYYWFNDGYATVVNVP